MADAQSIKAGAAYVEMSLNDKALRAGLKAVKDKLGTFGLSVGAIGAGLAGLGAAITTPMFAAAKAFADAGSELNDMSVRTGLAVESLSMLGYAAQQSGTDMGTVEGAVRKLQKLIGAGRLGVPAAAKAFDELGVNLQTLSRLSPDRQFAVIAARIRAIKDPTARASAAMLLFGKSGTALLPMIQDLDDLSDEAKRLGLVMSTADAKAADSLGDALDTLTASVRAVWNAVGAALAPVLTDIIGTITRGVASVVAWVRANQPLVASAFKLGGALLAVGSALVAAVAGFSGIAAAVTLCLNPITLTVAALAGLTTWFFTSTRAGRAAASALGEAFATLKDDAFGAIDGITDALAGGDWRLAARVAMAAVKVEFLRGWGVLHPIWQQGVNLLLNTWEGFKATAVGVASDLYYKAAGIGVDLWFAWVRGMDTVKAAWASLKLDALDAAAGIYYGVLGTAVDLWFALKKGWGGVGDTIIKVLSVVSAYAKADFDTLKVDFLSVFDVLKKFASVLSASAQSALAGLDVTLSGLVAAGGRDAAEVLKSFRAARAGLASAVGGGEPSERDKKVEAERLEAHRKLDEKAAREMKGRWAGAPSAEAGATDPTEEARLAAHRRLDASQGREAAARGQANAGNQAAQLAAQQSAMEALAAGDASALDAALEHLHDLEIQARDLRLGVEQGGKPVKQPLDPGDPGAGVEAAAKKVDAAGSFSAFAARGLGVGASLAEDQLKEAKKQTALLEKSVHNQEAGALEFGD